MTGAEVSDELDERGAVAPPAPKGGFSRRRFLLKAILGLAITGGLVLFLVRYVNWHHIAALSRSANWWLLSTIVPFYLVLYVVRAERFILLAPGTPFSVMFCITAIHNFMLRVLPMRTGELSYAFLVRRAGTSGLGESLLGLFLLRLLDATAVVLIFVAALAIDRTTYRDDSQLALLIAGGVAVVGMLTVLFFRQLLALGFVIFAGTLKLLGLTRYQRVSSVVEKLGTLIRSYTRLTLRLILAQAALTLVVWMFNFVIVFAIMRGFSVKVSFVQAVLGGTGATVTGFLPVGGVGSFGALEAGWAVGFVLVGLAKPLAVATGFGFSLVTFAGAAVLALASWVLFNRLVGPEAQEVGDGS